MICTGKTSAVATACCAFGSPPPRHSLCVSGLVSRAALPYDPDQPHQHQDHQVHIQQHQVDDGIPTDGLGTMDLYHKVSAQAHPGHKDADSDERQEEAYQAEDSNGLGAAAAA